MRIAYLPSADADLADLHAYIFSHNERGADDQIDRIKIAVKRLQHYPLSAPARPDVGETARGLSIKPYVALYRVVDRTVEIVRVVHTARTLRCSDAEKPNDINGRAVEYAREFRAFRWLFAP